MTLALTCCISSITSSGWEISTTGNTATMFHLLLHQIMLTEPSLDYEGIEERSPPKEVFDKMVQLIENREFKELFAYDQLTKERDEEKAVFLGFKEGKFGEADVRKELVMSSLNGCQAHTISLPLSRWSEKSLSNTM